MIFNKNSAGAAELKALLGFIYKSNKFDNLISYIGFAERDIRKVIGDAVFDCAEAHYQSDHYKAPVPEVDPEAVPPAEPPEEHPEYLILDDLVAAIQLPVALHAYRRYAVQNDLGHSDSGRFITVTEEQKPAFEWMINKSDMSLLDLAHEATDLLLEFLDKHIDDHIETDPPEEDPTMIIPWGTSPEFAIYRELFISKDQFNNEFYIDGSRRIFLAIAPYIKKIQTGEILACIGKDEYDGIAEAILDDDVSEDQEKILVYVRPALAFLALSRAVIRLSIEVLPNGLFSNFVTGTINSKSAASIPDRVQVSQSLYRQGTEELMKLQEYLGRLTVEAAGETYTPVDLTERIDHHLKYVRL
jgi:hypothetical protein